MAEKTKAELEAELEAMQRQLAKSEKEKREAEEMVEALQADVDEANNRASLAVAPDASTAPPLDRKAPIEPGKHIADPRIKALHAKAKGQLNKELIDSPQGRQTWAGRAQDLVIALRDLKVGYSGHGVTLSPAGDLYFQQTGVHPRMLAQHLVKGHDVPDLADLVSELNSQLEYEAS